MCAAAPADTGVVKRSVNWLRDGTAFILCGIDPFLNNDVEIFQGLIPRCAICHAAGQIKDGCQEGLIFFETSESAHTCGFRVPSRSLLEDKVKAKGGCRAWTTRNRHSRCVRGNLAMTSPSSRTYGK